MQLNPKPCQRKFDLDRNQCKPLRHFDSTIRATHLPERYCRKFAHHVRRLAAIHHKMRHRISYIIELDGLVHSDPIFADINALLGEMPTTELCDILARPLEVWLFRANESIRIFLKRCFGQRHRERYRGREVLLPLEMR